jgi:hypothetical protein
MTIKLPTGKAWINGYFYYNSSDLALTIDTADGVLHRKDNIVIRWDLADRAITAVVVKGTPGSSPSAPAVVRTAEQYDLKIAEIYIAAGTTTITQGMITDTRLNSTVCGIATQTVETISTTTLYNQIQADLAAFKSTSEADFTEWVESIKDILDAETAGHLQLEIDEKGVQTYTCTKTGTIFDLTNINSPANGKFLATADYADGDTFRINPTDQLFNKDLATPGYVDTTDGTVKPSGVGNYVSPLIPITPSVPYRIIGHTYIQPSGNVGRAIYDATGTFISGTAYGGSTGNGYIGTGSTVYYVRYTINTVDLTVSLLELNSSTNTDPTYTPTVTALSADNTTVLPAGFFSNGETVNITYDASNTTIHFIKSANHSGRKVGSTVGTNSFVAGGTNNIASATYSHAEGANTTASAPYSHAEGANTTASGGTSHAEGSSTTASGEDAHAEGVSTTASGSSSHAEGVSTIANRTNSHAGGQFNLSMSSGDLFVLGNGTSDETRSNCFRVTNTGNVYGLAAFHSSGADYAEYFEWVDGNLSKENRAGYFVTLDGEKIKYANDGDYILGVTSAVPGIIGDSASESWKERWKTDIFGRIQYHDVTVPAQKDNKGNVIIKERVESQPITNPNYDNSKPYISREKRPEFAPVGMLGKLVCIDDGTCEVNGYCIPKNGIAIKSKKGYRIIERLDDTHIKIIMR